VHSVGVANGRGLQGYGEHGSALWAD
jgi:hypothetical protein